VKFVVGLLATLIALSPAGGQAEWTIAPRPVLDIVGLADDGTLNFGLVRGATRLTSGGVLVADVGSMSIRVFDAKGRFVRNVGREGSGPGEFALIGEAIPCGRDSLLVWRPGDASMIDSTGKIARRFQIGGKAADPDPTTGLVCSGESIGYIGGRTAWIPTSETDVLVTRSSIALARHDGSGVWHADSIMTGVWVSTHPGGFPLPLGPTVYLAIVGDQLAVGISDSARVWLYRPDGRRTTLTIPASHRTPTDQQLENARAAVAGIGPPSTQRRVAQSLTRFKAPKSLPPYFGLWGDPDGLLWIQTTPPGDSPTNFLILSPDGQRVARASVTRPITIYEVGTDYLLGAVEDQNDETHIIVLPLRRR
jgi:hypothetical protein